jgi:hypothetical protein
VQPWSSAAVSPVAPAGAATGVAVGSGLDVGASVGSGACVVPGVAVATGVGTVPEVGDPYSQSVNPKMRPIPAGTVGIVAPRRSFAHHVT